MEYSVATVKHFANIGDAIASLAGLKKYYELTGKKIIFTQQINVRGTYYPSAVHPTKNDKGEEVMCNQKMFDMLKPLLLCQDYIHDVQVYNGQKIDIDLDVIRQGVFVNLPYMAIQSWIFMAFPDIATDLSKQWMTIGDIDVSNCKIKSTSGEITAVSLDFIKDKAVINFTERYRNPHLNYFFLKNYKDSIIFAGTENEYEVFCKQWELDIPYLIVNDFLELAHIIKNSKFLLGCQSFCWGIAESLKTPRILELCTFAPNCQPFIGEDSYGYLSQVGLVYYFETLMSKL